MVFTYVVLQLSFWWLVHVVSFSWGVLFPFHFKRAVNSGHTKYILMIVLPTGLILPCLTFITALVESIYYREPGLPPFCYPFGLDVAYYTLALPVSIMLTIVVLLTSVVLMKIVKVSK